MNSGLEKWIREDLGVPKMHLRYKTDSPMRNIPAAPSVSAHESFFQEWK